MKWLPDLYEKAMEAASFNEFRRDAALAFQLASRFHRERNRPQMAAYYLMGAHERYREWGADGVVRFLEEKWPDLFTIENTEYQLSRRTASGVFTTTQTVSFLTSTQTTMALEALDLKTVIKSSMAISGEIVIAMPNAPVVHAAMVEIFGCTPIALWGGRYISGIPV